MQDGSKKIDFHFDLSLVVDNKAILIPIQVIHISRSDVNLFPCIHPST
jgi:hypothetical protein